LEFPLPRKIVIPKTAATMTVALTSRYSMLDPPQTTMSKEPIKFSPPCTEEFDREAFVATRVCQLRKSLQDETYAGQKDNITLAIKLYESNDLPLREGGPAWFLNGKFYAKRLPAEIPDGSFVWAEVCFTSL
jgi:hypothetical protein